MLFCDRNKHAITVVCNQKYRNSYWDWV